MKTAMGVTTRQQFDRLVASGAVIQAEGQDGKLVYSVKAGATASAVLLSYREASDTLRLPAPLFCELVRRRLLDVAGPISRSGVTLFQLEAIQAHLDTLGEAQPVAPRPDPLYPQTVPVFEFLGSNVYCRSAKSALLEHFLAGESVAIGPAAFSDLEIPICEEHLTCPSYQLGKGGWVNATWSAQYLGCNVQDIGLLVGDGHLESLGRQGSVLKVSIGSLRRFTGRHVVGTEIAGSLGMPVRDFHIAMSKRYPRAKIIYCGKGTRFYRRGSVPRLTTLMEELTG